MAITFLHRRYYQLSDSHYPLFPLLALKKYNDINSANHNPKNSISNITFLRYAKVACFTIQQKKHVTSTFFTIIKTDSPQSHNGRYRDRRNKETINRN